MANLRQTILIRTDLNLSPGLLAAQVAHLHAKMFYEYFCNRGDKNSFLFPTSDIVNEWAQQPYVFVHGVPLIELFGEYFIKCKNNNVPFYEWTDTITIKVGSQNKVFSELYIGMAIGPEESDKIKNIIGDLPLL